MRGRAAIPAPARRLLRSRCVLRRFHTQRYVPIDDQEDEDEGNRQWGNSCGRICGDYWIQGFQERGAILKSESVAAHLENRDLWEIAYWRSCRALGSYIPRGPLPRNLAAQLDPLREACLSKSYDWGGTGTLYLTPAFLSPTKLPELQDRVVQEVLLMLLEPAFEKRFSHRSFAFRPGRSAITALKYITGSFQECKWFVVGDATSILASLDVDAAMAIFGKSVEDEIVAKLVRDGLITETKDTIVPEEYFESRKKGARREILAQEVHRLTRERARPFWLKCFLKLAPIEAHKIPRWGSCQIFSPLLLNIYLNELDQFVERRIQELDRVGGDGRMMEYVRYAGHFLLGIKGPDEEIVRMEATIAAFCREELEIRLAAEIFHVSQKVPFLAHTIQGVDEDLPVFAMPKSFRSMADRDAKQKIRLVADMKHCVESLARLKILELPPRKRMKILPCLRLLKARQEDANAQIAQLLHLLAGFYRLASNRKKVTLFLAFVLRSSLAILYANKYRLQTRAKVYKLGGDDLSWKIKGKKGVFEYARRRSPLPDEIAGIPYRYAYQVLPPLFLPVTKHWMPFHEICLARLIEARDPSAVERELSRFRDSDLGLRQALVEAMASFECAKPLSEIIDTCNDC